MREDVVALLDAFGVTGAADDPLLDFIIATVTERIKNETNQPAIPDGLNRLAVFEPEKRFRAVRVLRPGSGGQANPGRGHQHGFCHWGGQHHPGTAFGRADQLPDEWPNP